MQLTGRDILIGEQPIQIYVWDFVCVCICVGEMKNELGGETRKSQDSLKV